MASSKLNQNSLVLFIDDDPALLHLGRISLERAGFSFVGATNGYDGLRFAAELYPDIIVLDYMMPGISGKEVFEALISSPDRRIRDIPVIMLTALVNNRPEQRQLLERGMAAYLCKPFGQHEFINIIDNVLVMAQIKSRNRELEAESRQSFISTVRSLISLLAVKDAYTGEHSNMMVDLTELLAQRLGLSETEITGIKLGALLHDVGKIGIPEEILRKPGRLTDEEMSIMRRHVAYGDEALEGLPHMETVRSVVKSHHEWWNGGGYPSGFCGEEIPLGARIVAVVDAYDAMTSDRPYRPHLEQEVAIARLRAGVGTQFDPMIVEHLANCLGDYNPVQPRAMNLSFLENLDCEVTWSGTR
jgi:putative two-component system response regulator